MSEWLVVAGVVAAGGLGAAVAAWLADLRPQPDAARAEIARGLDLADAALLSGGVVRWIDTAVVGFVERGLVRAADGRLTVRGDVDRMLDTPLDSPAHPGLATLEEAIVLSSVRRAGEGGLGAVRRSVATWDARRRLARLAERGLLITPRRRQWGPMIVAGPVLLGLFGCAMALIVAGPESEAQATIVIASWLPVSLGSAFLWSRRPGHHGRDPRSSVGRAVVADLRAARASSQADLVASGGFEAMTDEALRDAVQAGEPDSRWRVPLRRTGTTEVNALLAVQTIGSTLGGSDGGGDGGGGGD